MIYAFSEYSYKIMFVPELLIHYPNINSLTRLLFIHNTILLKIFQVGRMAVAFPDSQPVDHLTAVAKSGKAPGELWFPSGVAIDLATNHIYVAGGGNYARVSIFSESGEYLNSCTHEYMKSLWGIAIHGNNLYVTDCVVHAVFHLKLEADFHLVSRLGSRGSGIGQFDHPLQLSISTNGDVYIADRENNRIQILDSSLHPIRKVTHPSIHWPCDVKVTTEKMYVLSWDDSPCVHVFTHTGHKIRSLITCGFGIGMQVTRPLFFCLDTKRNIIISDYQAHLIKIFSNEGALLYTIGQPGHEAGMLYYPQGLALTSNLKLVTVSRNDNYGLQIFSSL